METGPRNNIRELVVDPHTFIPYISEEKVRQLLVDIDMIEESYDRQRSVAYLAHNFSNNSHLAMTVLNSLKDDDIKEYVSKAKSELLQELEKRKNH